MKVVMGLGNPGPEYDATRHNVGWWVADRLAYDWDFPTFRRDGRALVSDGRVADAQVRLMKPTTYMNRSGLAVRSLESLEGFEPSEDLLVVVDDAALDVGRIRFRPTAAPAGTTASSPSRARCSRTPTPACGSAWARSLKEWTSPTGCSRPCRRRTRMSWLRLLPELTKAVETWVSEGVEAAMTRFNR
jgi:peptidyl-tRNA hydrolase, PTH1 family